MKKSVILIFMACLVGFAITAPKQGNAKISGKDIIAMWTFDKGTKSSDAIDISGDGHNGTFDLGATRGDGRFHCHRT